MLTIKNYQVSEQIYESNNSVVYRGVREVDNQPVILKLLHGEYPTPQQLTSYRQEYEMTRSLTMASVVQVYELLPYRNSLVMVLEDFGGQSLKSLGGAGTLSLEAFLPLAIKLSEVVGQVHQVQIMHKDINPANVVYNPVTKVMKLIDFGISTRLSREYTTFRNVNNLEGTLAYISPEQTGRMNRVIDYRTDFYSLGVTFYELLTGRLPFMSDDALELLHSHIARQPIAPHKINPQIPPILSDVILKLMTKNAEDRYQSAFGLQYDLEQVLKTVETGHALSLQLGTRDFSGYFHIPQKLYGRQKEIDLLLQGFARVAGGDVETGHALSLQSEMLLVAGYSGVGKSALVHEVHKPMTEKRGYFITGKYDQYQRNMPYYALSQALNDFCHQILTESAESLASWRERIQAAVGHNGQVLLEVAPSLELIIGAQPAVVEVGPQEAQNRFNVVLQAFVQVLSQPQHPLVMFIDDLQWADLASLNALRSLMGQAEIKHCFIIGAYRDNEVDSSHPLMVMLKEMKQDNLVVNQLRLDNLTEADVQHLVADTLHNDHLAGLQELSSLIYSKTQGNAFFTTEFLKSLYEQQLLTFNFSQQQWQWDMAQVTAQNITDNVVVLLADKLNKMSAELRAVLKLAACIGNQFDLRILAIIAEQTPAETLTVLWAAIQENLLIPLDNNYRLWQVMGATHEPTAAWFKFSHDRIQQAAYSLIDEAARPAVHLQIGRLWLANSWAGVQNLEPVLFDVINQLNAGRALITDETERLQLVTLNLQAGQKAKNAIAYQPALNYMTIALALLPADLWTTHHELTFKLTTEQAECEFLLGQLTAAEATFKLALEHAQTNLEKGQVLSSLVLIYSSKLDFKQWEEASSQGLRALGLEIPFHGEAVTAEIEATRAQIQTFLADKEIAAVLALAELTDEAKLKAMDLCIKMLTVAIIRGNLNLYALLGMKMVMLSLEFGNSIFASNAYVTYGSILVINFGDYRRGYEWGQLGLQLAEKYPTSGIHVKNYFRFASYINHWRQPAKTSADYFLQGYVKGVEVGDLTYSGYTSFFYIKHLLFMGANLEMVAQQTAKYFTFAEKIKNQLLIDAFLSPIYLILALTGQERFQDTALTVELLIQKMRGSNNQQSLIRYLIYRLKADYLHGDYNAALQVAQEGWPLVPLMAGSIIFAEFYFYHALTLVALWPTWTENEQTKILATIMAHHALLITWRENCPENFAAMEWLLAAEVARVQGRGMESLELYDQAIAAAKEQEFLHVQALANELAAKFWLALDKPRFAALYLQEAHYAYQRWGATVKVAQLEADYVPLFMTVVSHRGHLLTTTGHTTQSSHALDLKAVMKAAQAISSEIELETLLTTLMQIVMQTAGAERSLLLLPKEGQWGVKAVGSINNDGFKVNVKATVSLDNSVLYPETRLALAIVNYVIRTHTVIVLSDASHEEMFQRDEYIRRYKPKSLLCIPLLKQGELEAVVYLENNVAVGAFTPEQVQLLELLAAQAAISLDNAQLLAERQETIAKLQEIDQLKTEFLTTMSHELRTPLNSILGFSDLLIQGIYGDLPDMAMNDIQVIHNSGQYLLAIINDILDITKIEAGMMEIVPEPLEAAEVVTEVINTASSLVQHKPITLSMNMAEELPLIEADKTRLKQILLNLLDNAIKFTAQGEVTISVGVHQLDPMYMEFAVQDTGMGIPPDKQAHIFEAFHQVDMSRTRSHGGTGLGLTICQRLVAMHGGRIWVESEVGVGTTVSFTVRLDKA